MSTSPAAELVVAINLWSLIGQPSPEAEWEPGQKLQAIRDAGFSAVTCGSAQFPQLADLLQDYGLSYGGFFDAGEGSDFDQKIAAALAVGDGPMNCQLADHDTPVKKAVELAVSLMQAAEKQQAEVYLEVHRDTCTETPEKAYAIAAAYEERTGKTLPMNFDFSHPAVVKHLHAGNYCERLFERVDLFQQSRLWHFRPFNGHHCQIPISDGAGGFVPEYRELRPFVREAFRLWLEANAGSGRTFWVVPELGPLSSGYGLSCFPNIWQDTIVLGRDLQAIWNEVSGES